MSDNLIRSVSLVSETYVGLTKMTEAFELSGAKIAFTRDSKPYQDNDRERKVEAKATVAAKQAGREFVHFVGSMTAEESQKALKHLQNTFGIATKDDVPNSGVEVIQSSAFPGLGIQIVQFAGNRLGG